MNHDGPLDVEPDALSSLRASIGEAGLHIDPAGASLAGRFGSDSRVLKRTSRSIMCEPMQMSG